MGTQQVVNENVDQQLEQFWVNFQLFPLQWERRIFTNFLPLVGVSVFPYLVLTVGVLSAHFMFGMDREWVIEKLTDWQTVIISLGLVIITPFYLRWQETIPTTFRWLLDENRIEVGNESKYEYLDFLRGYQRMLSDGFRRYSFSILFCIFVLVFNLVDADFVDYIEDGRTMDAMVSIIKRIFGLFFWGYLSGLVIWPIFATGNQVSKLSKQFKINVQARHPDRCGGLKPLGDICFSMALPLVIVGIMLFLLALSGVAPFDISFLGIDPSQTGEDTVLFANVLLILFFLPLTAITFIVPLWNVHQEMVRKKTNYEEEFSTEIIRLEDQLRVSLREEDGLEIAKIVKEKMEILQVLNPNTIGFPVWPFRYNRLLTLFSPQLLGGISTVVGIFQAIFRNP